MYSISNIDYIILYRIYRMYKTRRTRALRNYISVTPYLWYVTKCAKEKKTTCCVPYVTKVTIYIRGAMSVFSNITLRFIFVSPCCKIIFLCITIKTNCCSGIRGPVSEERYINGKKTEMGELELYKWQESRNERLYGTIKHGQALHSNHRILFLEDGKSKPDILPDFWNPQHLTAKNTKPVRFFRLEIRRHFPPPFFLYKQPYVHFYVLGKQNTIPERIKQIGQALHTNRPCICICIFVDTNTHKKCDYQIYSVK
eukprot:GEMP01074191.1.p1 GENE.GEMP01074191.1~~GEMP01074191.1.p1  ORF type:complete len:255 (-),score=-17.90 GEMP01074191.1:4-768(-)